MTRREIWDTVYGAAAAAYEPREARAVAALVCEDRLGLRFTDVIVEPDAPCPLRDDLQRLAFEIGSYRPAQYIAGFCRFCGRKFSLEEGVLIPRPETEELVRTIVERHRSDSGLRILDIGTGSGCIAVTLAAELPDARVTAVDISDTALRIARRNAERLRQTVRFERRDILTGPPEGEFDLIVSNPPYVTESEKRQMSPNVLRYEPHRALFVPDDDPLLFYRAIAGLGRRLFAPGLFRDQRAVRHSNRRIARKRGLPRNRPVEGLFRKAQNGQRAMEVKRTKTPEQALRALMNVCAKSERAISDVRRSLTRWGVAPEQHQPIIDRLVRERFIDEARYAEAYVREKLNLSRWGVRKIRAALKAKRIPEQTIDEALAQADPQKLGTKLEESLRRKMQGTRAVSDYQMRGKLLRYGAGLGFDYDEVSDAIDRLMREREK